MVSLRVISAEPGATFLVSASNASPSTTQEPLKPAYASNIVAQSCFFHQVHSIYCSYIACALQGVFSQAKDSLRLGWLGCSAVRARARGFTWQVYSLTLTMSVNRCQCTTHAAQELIKILPKTETESPSCCCRSWRRGRDISHQLGWSADELTAISSPASLHLISMPAGPVLV